MKRTQIINELKRFFSIKELVCDHAYSRFGENSWFLIPTFWLHTLLIIRRDIIRREMICNKYDSQSKMYTQRGTRCNLCQLVKDETAKGNSYNSSHLKNVGNDFNVTGMTAEQARQEIVKKSFLLEYPVRLESDVSWLHIDGFDQDNGKQVTFFKG